MSGCTQRTGFLIPTICGEPAAAFCAGCGKAICAAHLCNDPKGPLCPDCAVMGLDYEEASRRGLDSSFYRSSMNADPDMKAYDPSDYESFESYRGEGGDMGGGGAGGEWGGSDETGGPDEGGAGDFQDS